MSRKPDAVASVKPASTLHRERENRKVTVRSRGVGVVPDPPSPNELECDRRKRTMTAEAYDKWNHSECQSGCVRRGDKKCLW